MRLSGLQRFALRQCYARRSEKVPRKVIHAYYTKSTRSIEHVQDVVTKSLDSLIDKGLLIGYGRRTERKWFIEEIRLTPLGRRVARALLGKQLALPFKTNSTR